MTFISIKLKNRSILRRMHKAFAFCLVIFAWQVVAILGGQSTASFIIKPFGVVYAADEPVKLPSTSPRAPARANMIGDKPLSERERQLLHLQQATQSRYIETVNELELLKLSLEIANTNKGISDAKLAIIKNQKALVDLLTPPAKREATASNYAQGLSGGNVIQDNSGGYQAAAARVPQPSQPSQSQRQMYSQQAYVPAGPSASAAMAQVASSSAPVAQPALSAAQRQQMVAEMSASMRSEYDKLSSQLSESQKDAFLRMSPEEQKTVASMPPQEKQAFIQMPPEQQTAYVAMPPAQKEEYKRLSSAEQKEFLEMPPAQKEAFVSLPPEEKQAFISMPPQQKAAFVKMSKEEKKRFVALPPSEKQKVAAVVAPEAAPTIAPVGEEIRIVPYSVVSVAQLRGTWTAVIGGANTLFSVQTGDVLPPDNSVVRRIDRDGVTLETAGQMRKVSLVSII